MLPDDQLTNNPEEGENLASNNEDGSSQNESSQSQLVKIGEKEFTTQQLEEAIKDSENKKSWQTVNTQRAQELADQERNIAKARQLDEFLSQNPELYERFESLVEEYQKGDNQQAPSDKVQSEVTYLKNAFKQYEEMQNIKEEINELKQKFPDDFKEKKDFDKEIVKYALDKKIYSMHDAYKSLMFDKAQEKARTSALKEDEEAKKKSQQLSSPGGVKSAPSKGGVKGNWTEIEEKMRNSPLLDAIVNGE